MYNIKQSMTMPQSSLQHSVERFNHRMHDLQKTLPKEKMENCLLYIPSLVFTDIVMSHTITGFQPYEHIMWHEAPAVCDAWLGQSSYNNKTSISLCAWLNEQHEVLVNSNWHALKHIKNVPRKAR